MSLEYPLGLLALIAIPILIIIYIIINKYTEQVIPATYLWTLSEKFLKRKNPIKSITGLLSLILQILIVVLIAFSLAQPSFALPGAAHDYLFILDGSGSMNIAASDGSTRLQSGKNKITEIVNGSADGSTYTLIYSAESTSVLCDSIEDKSRVISLLGEADGGYCASNLGGALSAAQEKFTENPSLKIYLITDKDFEDTSDNFEIVNLSSGEENYAVSDVKYDISDGNLTVTGNLWSYESAAELTVSLYINGSDVADSAQKVSVSRLEACAFEFVSDSVDFSSLTVSVSEKDGLMLDNESTVYSLRSDSFYNTLIVYSDEGDYNNSFLIEAALSSFGDVNIDTVPASRYSASDGGYGLYIFDSYTPSQLPADGAVWFVNPRGNVANTGFSVQNTVSLDFHGVMEFSSSTSTRVQTLLEGTVKNNIYVKNYVKCGLNKNFYTLLSYSDNPLLFAGTNSYGNREVVFAFDLHETDFTLSEDYIPLMTNLFKYTFPEIVSETLYYCGDTVEINVLANCTGIRIDTPLNNVESLDFSGDAVEYVLTEAGTYTVTLKIGGSALRVVYIYAELPLEERYTAVKVAADGSLVTYSGDEEREVLGADGAAKEVVFKLSGDAADGSHDGTYSELWVWFLAIAIIFLIDWGVYCYEQYQLR